MSILDQETVETLVELTVSNRKNRTIAKRT
jgi:hypothetical protein